MAVALLSLDVLSSDITPERFVQVLKSVRAYLLTRHGTLHNAFKQIDKDNSGSISHDELLESIQASPLVA